jgi:hypothetical protein
MVTTKLLRLTRASLLAACAQALLASAGEGQTGSGPGPTNPAPPTNPQSKPGATIVINPTAEECGRGWEAGMRWTKEQFDQFCSRLGASK